MTHVLCNIISRVKPPEEAYVFWAQHTKEGTYLPLTVLGPQLVAVVTSRVANLAQQRYDIVGNISEFTKTPIFRCYRTIGTLLRSPLYLCEELVLPLSGLKTFTQSESKCQSFLLSVIL